MADKVTFATNIPVEAALKYASPKEVASHFSDSPQYMFTLVDGRVMFLPKYAADRVTELGVLPGEPFSIAKVERQEGRRKIQDWEVKRVFAPGQFAEAGAVAAAPAVPSQSNYQSIQYPNGNGTQQHNGYPDANVNGRPPMNLTGLPASREEVLADAMRVAIRVLDTTRQYAGHHGIDFKISEREVISLGCTVFINSSKEGR
jgi:hypothetical protein